MTCAHCGSNIPHHGPDADDLIKSLQTALKGWPGTAYTFPYLTEHPPCAHRVAALKLLRQGYSVELQPGRMTVRMSV